MLYLMKSNNYNLPNLITFNFPEPSGVPKAIQVSILSSTSIEVRWLPIDFLDQNGIIIGYTVILTNMKTGSSHEYNTSGNVTVRYIEGEVLFLNWYW